MKHEIVITAPGHKGTLERLQNEFSALNLWEAPDRDAALKAAAPRIRALAHFGSSRVDGRLMDALPKLELISNFGVGVDQIDLQAFPRSAIGRWKRPCATFWNRYSRTISRRAATGCRPGRGCREAVGRVEELLRQGHVWCVDCDLKSYFDTIPHDRLMTLVKQRVVDGSVLALLAQCLKAGVLDELKGWQPTARDPAGGGD